MAESVCSSDIRNGAVQVVRQHRVRLKVIRLAANDLEEPRKLSLDLNNRLVVVHEVDALFPRGTVLAAGAEASVRTK